MTCNAFETGIDSVILLLYLWADKRAVHLRCAGGRLVV